MGKEVNIHKEMQDCANLLISIENMPLNDLSRKTYDKVGFVYDIKFIIKNLKFYFENVVKKTGDPKTSFYKLDGMNDPQEHDAIYVNLTRAFPKETFGGHYCYIIKKFEHNYLVAPITSIKESDDEKQNFEIDICVDGLDPINRLNLANITSIDLQRIYKSKDILKVSTKRETIIDDILKIIFYDSIDKSVKLEYDGTVDMKIST